MMTKVAFIKIRCKDCGQEVILPVEFNPIVSDWNPNDISSNILHKCQDKESWQDYYGYTEKIAIMSQDTNPEVEASELSILKQFVACDKLINLGQMWYGPDWKPEIPSFDNPEE